MEASTRQPEFSGQPKPDFYELLLENRLTDDEEAVAYKIFTINDMNGVIAKLMENFPDIEIISEKNMTPQGQLVTFIVDPSGRLVTLIEDTKKGQ